MKNTSLIFFIIVGICASAWAQDLMVSKPKLILLVNEQNIGGPRNAWWASEVDLSIAETRIATTLQGYGCQIIMPAQIKKEIQEERAFRVVDLTPAQSVKIASLAKAEYVLSGKAVASAGGKVPQSNMISCFANITAELIRVKDGIAVGYMTASGSSVHLDTITGGKEALLVAADDLSKQVMSLLEKEEENKK